jgi:hypothetical protein
MAKVSEAYHRPGAVQWASATAFLEKEAVMMAVMVTHCARHQWLGFMGTALLFHKSRHTAMEINSSSRIFRARHLVSEARITESFSRCNVCFSICWMGLRVLKVKKR